MWHWWWCYITIGRRSVLVRMFFCYVDIPILFRAFGFKICIKLSPKITCNNTNIVHFSCKIRYAGELRCVVHFKLYDEKLFINKLGKLWFIHSEVNFFHGNISSIPCVLLLCINMVLYTLITRSLSLSSLPHVCEHSMTIQFNTYPIIPVRSLHFLFYLSEAGKLRK